MHIIRILYYANLSKRIQNVFTTYNQYIHFKAIRIIISGMGPALTGNGQSYERKMSLVIEMNRGYGL